MKFFFSFFPLAAAMTKNGFERQWISESLQESDAGGKAMLYVC